eukprot:1342757-Pleurochrysis_carterae.AAC.7
MNASSQYQKRKLRQIEWQLRPAAPPRQALSALLSRCLCPLPEACDLAELSSHLLGKIDAKMTKLVSLRQLLLALGPAQPSSTGACSTRAHAARRSVWGRVRASVGVCVRVWANGVASAGKCVCVRRGACLSAPVRAHLGRDGALVAVHSSTARRMGACEDESALEFFKRWLSLV